MQRKKNTKVKPKNDYSAKEFYDGIYGYCLQGYNDKEIAHALDLDPSVFSRMVNGKYTGWTKTQNKEYGERLCQVLAHGRAKLDVIINGAYLKAALGGKKIKSKTRRFMSVKCDCNGTDPQCPKCHGLGVIYSDKFAIVDETEQELAPNVQALANLKFHRDEEWRRVDRNEDSARVPSPDEIEHGIDIDSWIKDKIK